MPNSDLPFLLDQRDELSRWRADTFWSKEPETIKWISDCVLGKGLSTFIDVGANIGVYSLYAASLSRSLETYAVEPDRKNRELLVQNIALNGFQERIHVIEFPLSSGQYSGSFYSSDMRPGSSGGQFQKSVSSESGVLSLSGDSLVTSYGIESAFVKIDVDGTELDIASGFSTSLEEGKIKTLLLEITEETENGIQLLLEKFNYLEVPSEIDALVHSDHRRKLKGSSERNKIFSKNSIV